MRQAAAYFRFSSFHYVVAVAFVVALMIFCSSVVVYGLVVYRLSRYQEKLEFVCLTWHVYKFECANIAP